MIRSILTYYLSLSILLGSTGVNVFTHVCHLFDTRETTLFTIDKCCGEESNGKETTEDFKCCSIDHQIYILDIESEKTQSTLSFELNAVSTEFISYDYSENTISEKIPFFSDSSPPRRYNRSLLSFIQVMRV